MLRVSLISTAFDHPNNHSSKSLGDFNIQTVFIFRELEMM